MILVIESLTASSLRSLGWNSLVILRRDGTDALTVNLVGDTSSNPMNTQLIFETIALSQASEVMPQWGEGQCLCWFGSFRSDHSEKWEIFCSFVPFQGPWLSSLGWFCGKNLCHSGMPFEGTICYSMNNDPEDKTLSKYRMFSEPILWPKVSI